MERLIKVVFSVSFVFYLVALVILLFLGSRSLLWSDLSLMEYVKSSSNFLPFKTISTYITAMFDGSMNRDIPIKNLFGNFILFLPMGIYLPYFAKRINKVRTFTFSMMILLLVIEVIQVVTRLGSLDIDDFILNMVGALIGFAIWKANVVQKLVGTEKQRKKRLA